mmetsp:Transcript_21043/g.47493  ORF Transcript_21043/g.47493 Transcript_21043/m.47493 type:complete len:106 (-) Transcript_21043:11-328(-)
MRWEVPLHTSPILDQKRIVNVAFGIGRNTELLPQQWAYFVFPGSAKNRLKSRQVVNWHISCGDGKMPRRGPSQSDSVILCNLNHTIALSVREDSSGCNKAFLIEI